jgi:hypothetical protein
MLFFWVRIIGHYMKLKTTKEIGFVLQSDHTEYVVFTRELGVRFAIYTTNKCKYKIYPYRDKNKTADQTRRRIGLLPANAANFYDFSILIFGSLGTRVV